MRHHFLYITGLCLIMSLPARAAGLPANPWLHATDQNAVKTGTDYEENADNAAAKAAELTDKVNDQMENYGNMLQQATSDALQNAETAAKAQDVENLPSWQDIMGQITPEKSESNKAQQQQQQQPATDFSDPLGIGKISQAVTDAQAQYNRAKATTGAYYNQARNKLKQLEREAQNSVNEVQKMIK